MQLLTDASRPGVSPETCAEDILGTVPQVMQFIRRQMRSLRGQELSVPQIRTLYFLSLYRRSTLSSAAEYIGLSLPAMSRLVEALVKKALVTRTVCPDDRRHVRLELTPRGRQALDAAWKGTHHKLAQEVAALSADQREAVSGALAALRSVFEHEPAAVE